MSRFLATVARLVILTAGISAGGVFGGENVAIINKYDYRNDSWTAWRTPGRDAVNCLYLLSKQCGTDCTYEDVRKAFGGSEQKQSLLDLRDAVRALGLSTSVYRCSSASLGLLNVPVIAHMEGNTRSEGHFSVLLPSLSNSDPIMIDGYTTQLVEMKTDKLLRIWDGFILKPEFGSTQPHWLLATCVFLPLAAVRIYVSLGYFKAPSLSNGVRKTERVHR